MRGFLTTAGAVAMLVLPAVAQAEQVWTRFSVAQARTIIVAEGGKVEEVKETDDGEYVMNARSSDDLPFKLSGFDCQGAGEARSCVRYEFSAFFKLDSAAQALGFEHSVAINWLADQADEDGYLDVWRMGSMEGGVTPAHMRYQLDAFISSVWAAQETVYPPKRTAGSSSKR